LTYVANFATEAQPRGIRIDPSGQYLVASGEKSDRLSVYKIDQNTGKLGEQWGELGGNCRRPVGVTRFCTPAEGRPFRRSRCDAANKGAAQQCPLLAPKRLVI